MCRDFLLTAEDLKEVFFSKCSTLSGGEFYWLDQVKEYEEKRQICDLGLISGIECQNDGSICLDIKLEINNGVLQMEIDDIWGYAICICGVRRYYLRKQKFATS
ncbi:hypothetical protein CFP56_035077 [Quercus suber]|uniref:Uncharacterized protein n=1 Tax=Quercus suber TaxID=58331 RepID=A0AAW0JAA2_QUESU